MYTMVALLIAFLSVILVANFLAPFIFSIFSIPHDRFPYLYYPTLLISFIIPFYVISNMGSNNISSSECENSDTISIDQAISHNITHKEIREDVIKKMLCNPDEADKFDKEILSLPSFPELDVKSIRSSGQTHRTKSEFALAKKYDILALSLAPDDSGAWNELGLALAYQGYDSLALASFKNSYRFSTDRCKTNKSMNDYIKRDKLTRVIEQVIEINRAKYKDQLEKCP